MACPSTQTIPLLWRLLETRSQTISLNKSDLEFCRALLICRALAAEAPLRVRRRK
ncbi:MAG: hypothetical protein GPJ10_23835 [Microcystis aeruginosa L211-07]|nr:hypothetical protein [Microcystis aeruginosa L211-07]